jgi:hypothetical protein
MTGQEVTEVRATGRTPEAVTAEIQEILSTRADGNWELFHVQPIIYNSSTTGYLLLFFKQSAPASAVVDDPHDGHPVSLAQRVPDGEADGP